LREERAGHPDDHVGIAFCESDFKRLDRFLQVGFRCQRGRIQLPQDLSDAFSPNTGKARCSSFLTMPLVSSTSVCIHRQCTTCCRPGKKRWFDFGFKQRGFNQARWGRVSGVPAPSARSFFLLLPWIVGVIHVNKVLRAHAVKLNDGFLACPGEMLDAFGCLGKSTGL
jgi:hypothetical protein